MIKHPPLSEAEITIIFNDGYSKINNKKESTVTGFSDLKSDL